MQLKTGVRLLGLRPELIIAYLVAQEVFRAHGVPLIQTAGIEGKHATSPPSEHYQGMAFDCRVKHLPPKVSAGLVFQQIVLALGGPAGATPGAAGDDGVAQANDFEVRHEGVGTATEHIHIAFRPNRPLATPTA